jgi:hypothetical protein
MDFNVVAYWDSIAKKAGDTRSWHDLGLHNQQVIIQSINGLIFVLSTNNTNQAHQNTQG